MPASLTKLKVMTMNVRGLFISHWDLQQTIANHNPLADNLVLTETKLTKSHKPRTWIEHHLKGSHGGPHTTDQRAL